jgi:hypothetical protein
MMSRDTQTDLAVGFEAARGGQEAEGGWSQGICWREYDAAVVDSAGEGRRLRSTADCEVPFEEILFQGSGIEVWSGVCGYLGGFFDYPGG